MNDNGSADPRWFRSSQAERLDPDRLRRARVGFSCRRVPFGDRPGEWDNLALVSGPVRPRPGDLCLARVERLGHHRRLELVDGRRSRLSVGDEVIVAYGDRYASDQFEAEVPADLGMTNLAAAGGIASTVLTRHSSSRRPTELQPIGLLAWPEGAVINLGDFKLSPGSGSGAERPPCIAVLGTSMNAGKTTSAASLIEGLVAAGERVGGVKVTGTGAGGDYWAMVDAGATKVVDFTDAGHATTYRLSLPQVEGVVETLVGHLADEACSAIVVEVADGVYQRETAALLRSETFHRSVDAVIFAAADAVGAVAGAQIMASCDLPVVAVSGTCTASPLALREIRSNIAVAVLEQPELATASTASGLLEQATAHRRDRTSSRPAVRASTDVRETSMELAEAIADPFASIVIPGRG